MKSSAFLRLAARLLALSAAMSTCLPAQETRSTINGTVTDQMGALVSGAKIVITNVGTSISARITTNETGFHEAPLLIPGAYRITATASGFKTIVRDGITLQVGQQLSIDLRLDLGAVTETVQVTAEAPVLDTSSIESGTLIDNKELMDLPVMGNNPTLLTKLLPVSRATA